MRIDPASPGPAGEAKGRPVRGEAWLVDASLFSLPYDRSLAEALAETGWRVRLLTRPLRPGEPALPATIVHEEAFYRRTDGLRTSRIGLVRRLGTLAKGLDHVLGMARLCAAVARSRPAVVHFIWSAVPALDRFAVRFIRRYCPVVVTVHNSVPFHGTVSFMRGEDAARRINSLADALVVHVETTRDHLVAGGTPAERIRLIAHPPLVYPTALPSPRSDAEFRLLMFGMIKPYKGLDTLLDAADAAAPASPRLRLRVVGKPFVDMEPILQRVAASPLRDRASFRLDFVSEDEISAEIAASDCLVFPYHEIDGSGAVSLGLTFDKPMVVSDAAGFRSLGLTEDERAVCMFPAADAEALASLLLLLSRDESARTRNRDAFRRLKGTLGDWRGAAEAHGVLYDGVRRSAAA